ncbi:PREDICTED: general transcription factor II-I repeat domain-containing protein 2-like [Priapulus caudatus]|uniref:General transcription factor II-I repeat domain-containing protein 2-like n=1 Tax=Priapulus caudatus TaxID=37621 RepID=A0ABM1F5F8_PRICU|nr:PREDICTED: general transcription factor II-I repeat domain-containing protein 2-like [Priapulus caudatus]
MCPEKAPILNSLSLSARTVSTRIEELSKNLSDQLHSAASQFKVFSLALDESTDISDTAQLAIFVRGVDDEFNITENFFALCPMKDTCTGKDVFQECDSAMKKANLNYEKLVGIATDGAPAMVGEAEKDFKHV